MKTLFKLLPFVLLFLIAKPNKLQAQVITAYLNDSLDNCPNPGNVYFYTNSNLSGFNIGDVVNQTIYFGDGNSYSFPTFIVSNPNQWTNNATIMHTYLTAGSFNAYMEVTGTGAATFTTPLNPVPIAGLVCGTASGTVYNDLNSNCIVDAGEAVNGGHIVQVWLGAAMLASGYTDAAGNYTVNFPYSAGNTYIVKKNFTYQTPCVGVICPNTITYAVTGQNSSNLDFGVGPLNNNMHDLWSYNMPGPGMFNAGSNKSYVLRYGNMGCVSANATFTVTLDPSMNFVSSVPAPATVVGNVLTYNLNNIQPQANYNATFITLNTFLPLVNYLNVPFVIGDSVSLTCSIAGVGGTEFDPTDNTRTRWYVIGTSYDPNDKFVSPQGQGPNGNVGFGTDFTYDIHFQNTGNAPAINVVITDTLDADIDENTIEILSNTHHMLFSKSGNALKFEFPNIMLPDSFSNSKGSMGALTFKAKHKSGLPNNTAIQNKAFIYFDVNPAVITSTTLNTLVSPSVIPNFAHEAGISFSPNPVSGILSIHSKSQNIKNIEIQNILGEVVARELVNDFRFSVNMSSYPAGVYLFKLTDDRGNYYQEKINKQ